MTWNIGKKRNLKELIETPLGGDRPRKNGKDS